MNKLQLIGSELVDARRSLKTLLAGLKDEEGNFREVTPEMESQLKTLEDRIIGKQGEYDACKRIADLSEANDTEIKALGETYRSLPRPDEDLSETRGLKAFTLPSNTRYSPVKNFKSIPGGMSAEQQAYGFAKWFYAAIFRDPDAIKFCKFHNLPLMYDVDGKGNIRAMSESVNTAGGALVPDEYANSLIDLREQFGVVRKLFRLEPMQSDTKLIPRRTGGATAYFVGEGSAITASDLTFDNVQLVAHKLAAITVYSSELNEDAMIDIGDRIMGEIAYAFANKEDDCGLNGDATSTYGGIVGVREKIKGLSSTIANIAGLVVASGTGYATDYASITLPNFQSVVAALPQFADTPNTRWVTHRTFYYNVMIREALEAGGVTKEEIINGQRTPMFLGYPVEFSQVLPKTSAVSQVCALLGDFKLGAAFGERRQVTLSVSDQHKWAEDQMAIRGTERIDIVVHDVGNASATAALRQAGPIVGLITAAS